MAHQDHSILLLEDDASVRESLRDFLHDHGYAVWPAATLREARQVLHQQRPAVCVIDLNLPDGNGLELLREAAARRLAIRAVVVTAFPLQHLRPVEQSAVVAWLTKPVSPGVLLDAVVQAFKQVATASGVVASRAQA